jgi:hypothetical protein
MVISESKATVLYQMNIVQEKQVGSTHPRISM